MAVSAPAAPAALSARGVVKAFGGRTILDGLDLELPARARVGLIGANGSGKTTLLRLLLGELEPQAGTVTRGTNLEIAYFDQHRAQLREDQSALDNVAEGREYIEVGGARKHALGYLQDFLFTPERARAPITALSGGERNRLLLAKLFARPSNLLVMDEPTNDLDIETLELLEDLLATYRGTLLLVSHDRDFLDNVVTSTLALEGGGHVGEYVGGYSDWLRQKPAAITQTATAAPARTATSPAAAAPEAPARRKLGYREARELEQLPARIEALEERIAARGRAMQDAAFYQQDGAAIAAANAELAALQAELDAAYLRWQALDSG